MRPQADPAVGVVTPLHFLMIALCLPSFALLVLGYDVLHLTTAQEVYLVRNSAIEPQFHLSSTSVPSQFHLISTAVPPSFRLQSPWLSLLCACSRQRGVLCVQVL